MKKNELVMTAVNDLTEPIEAPVEIAAAVMSGRPELLLAMQPRALDIREMTQVVNVIRVLLETNQSLQEHCRMIGREASELMNAFSGISKQVEQVRSHATFLDGFIREAGIEDN